MFKRNKIIDHKGKTINGPNNLIFTKYKDKNEKFSKDFEKIIKKIKTNESKDVEKILYNSNSLSEKEEIEELIRNDNVTEFKKKYDGITELNGEYLHYAAEHNATKIGKCLIDEGKFDINKMNEENFNPLHVASMEGNLEFVKLLVEKGAKLGEVDGNYFLNPLYLALTYENYDVAIYLIKNNVPVYEKDAEGKWDYCNNRIVLNLHKKDNEKIKTILFYMDKTKKN